MLRFAVRNAVALTPPIGRVPPLPSGQVRSLIEELGPPERLRLGPWNSSVRPWELAENRYVLALLEEVVPERLRTRRQPSLDVGCKSWAYLAAQRSVVDGPWDGVELDAHRRVGGLQTRESIARWRLRSHPDCRFVAGDVRSLAGHYGLVTWFLPFVTAGTHRRWGLPSSRFDPVAVLTHVWSLVADGGVLVITNQGTDEATLQGRLLRDTGIDAEQLGPVAARWSPFDHQRPVWRAQRVS